MLYVLYVRNERARVLVSATVRDKSAPCLAQGVAVSSAESSMMGDHEMMMTPLSDTSSTAPPYCSSSSPETARGTARAVQCSIVQPRVQSTAVPPSPTILH